MYRQRACLAKGSQGCLLVCVCVCGVGWGGGGNLPLRIFLFLLLPYFWSFAIKSYLDP